MKNSETPSWEDESGKTKYGTWSPKNVEVDRNKLEMLLRAYKQSKKDGIPLNEDAFKKYGMYHVFRNKNHFNRWDWM